MSRDRTITPQWNVPIYVVGSAIGLGVLMTSQWLDLKAEVQTTHRDAVTESQQRHWIEKAQDMNPTLHLPSLPDKGQNDAGKRPFDVADFDRRETEITPK